MRFQYSVERWSGWKIEGSLCLEWWSVSRHVLADVSCRIEFDRIGEVLCAGDVKEGKEVECRCLYAQHWRVPTW